MASPGAARELLILYGSQTGAAKSIAEGLHTDCQARGIASRLHALNEYAKAGFSAATLVLIVCSTTGNGDPPANAEDFWRFIRRRTHPKDMLAHMSAAILGLGDTNYDKFCYAAKTIHKRMLELGAKEFHSLGCADEAVGLDTVVEPWIRSLWPALTHVLCEDGGHETTIKISEKPVDAVPQHAVPIDAATLPPGSAATASAATMPSTSSAPAPAPHAPEHPVVQHAGVSSGPPTSVPSPAVPSHRDGAEADSLHISAPQQRKVQEEAGAGPHTPMSILAALTARKRSFDAAHGHPPAGHETTSAPTTVAAALPGTTAAAAGSSALDNTAVASILLSPGVKTFEEAFPSIRFSRDGPAHESAEFVPRYDDPAATKNLPKLPACGTRFRIDLAGEGSGIETKHVARPALGAVAKSAPVSAVQSSISLSTMPGAKSASVTDLTALAASSNPALLSAARLCSGTSGLASSPRSATAVPANPNLGRTADAPVEASLRAAHYLTSGGRQSTRRVLHMDICVADTPLNGAWVPGDSIGIIVPNDELLVRRVAERLLTPLQAVLHELESSRPAPASTESAAGADAPTSTTDATGAIPTWLQQACNGHVTFQDFLTWCIDLTSPPKKAFLRLLAEASSGKDRDILTFLCGRNGRNHFTTFIELQRLTLLDLLALFPSCRPDVCTLLAALPAMSPRYYSIASSPLAHSGIMNVAFTVVEYACGLSGIAVPGQTPPVEPPAHSHRTPPPPLPIHRRGVATTWLENLCLTVMERSERAGASGESSGAAPVPAPLLRVFLRPTRDFVLPAVPERPIVMIGPGTGVAPFIGFLQHRWSKLQREASNAVAVCRGKWRPQCRITSLREDAPYVSQLQLGPAYLFFGNRHPDVDFLYARELEDFTFHGVLTRLFTAFSRVGPEKVYVQHRIREAGILIADLIVNKNAHVFVCGDGASMAKDVHAALLEVLQAHGGETASTPEKAAELLNNLARKGRYVRDIWS